MKDETGDVAIICWIESKMYSFLENIKRQRV